MRALAALAAVISVLAAALALPSAESARTACPYQAQVITYNPRGWQPLLDSLAANQTPCAQYYVVLPPLEDKVTPRGRRLVEAVRSKGPNFHPVAEFSWKGWYAKPGTWYSKGVSFRRKMAAAGYDPRRGETWAINELPSTIRSRTDTRQRARDLIRGLYTRPAPVGALGGRGVHRRRRAGDAELRAVQGVAARLAAGRCVLDARSLRTSPGGVRRPTSAARASASLKGAGRSGSPSARRRPTTSRSTWRSSPTQARRQRLLPARSSTKRGRR